MKSILIMNHLMIMTTCPRCGDECYIRGYRCYYCGYYQYVDPDSGISAFNDLEPNCKVTGDTLVNLENVDVSAFNDLERNGYHQCASWMVCQLPFINHK